MILKKTGMLFKKFLKQKQLTVQMKIPVKVKIKIPIMKGFLTHFFSSEENEPFSDKRRDVSSRVTVISIKFVLGCSLIDF